MWCWLWQGPTVTERTFLLYSDRSKPARDPALLLCQCYNTNHLAQVCLSSYKPTSNCPSVMLYKFKCHVILIFCIILCNVSPRFSYYILWTISRGPCLCHFEITISQTILCALNTITIWLLTTTNTQEQPGISFNQFRMNRQQVVVSQKPFSLQKSFWFLKIPVIQMLPTSKLFNVENFLSIRNRSSASVRKSPSHQVE